MIRTSGLRLFEAIPAPIPVIAVNSGCANGESSPRITSTANTPPA
jgi:hypothetical protein